VVVLRSVKLQEKRQRVSGTAASALAAMLTSPFSRRPCALAWNLHDDGHVDAPIGGCAMVV
jgi:hypothetical protein